MTPSQLALHEAHKARVARIQANAYSETMPAAIPPMPDPIVSEAVPSITISAAPCPQIVIPDISEKELWFRMAGTRLTIRAIQEAVIRHYGITRVDLVADRREKRVVVPRQVAMYLCRLLTPYSFPKISKHFGGRDHTTAIHGARSIASKLLKDPVLAQNVAEIELVLDALEEAQHEAFNTDQSDEINSRKQEAASGSQGGAEGFSPSHAQAAS